MNSFDAPSGPICPALVADTGSLRARMSGSASSPPSPELVLNPGNPFTNLDDIFEEAGVTASLDDGAVVLVAADGSSDRAFWNFEGTVIGQTYDIEIRAQQTVGSSAQIRQAMGLSLPITSIAGEMTTYTFSSEATDTSGFIRVYPARTGNAGDTVRVEKVSVRLAQ